jgi:transketolase
MANLEKICKKIRLSIIESSYRTGACHISSALSCVEILVSLYWKILKKNDIFIFGKASGASALYCVLAERGIIKRSKVNEYLKKYPLASTEVKGVIHSVGSIGHALPVAVGMALGNRKRKVYVLLGDADVQEGTFWESILFSHQHKLDNLEILIDRNGLQACGKTEDILALDGVFGVIYNIFPIKVFRTIKGKGIDFMENDYTWHYKNLIKELYENAILQVSG